MEFIEKLYTGDCMSELRLYCCGRRLQAPDHRFGPADRAHYWFIYLKEGSGVFEMCGYAHPVGKGDVFVAFPDQRIRYRADAGSVWSIYWMALDFGAACDAAELGISAAHPVVHIHDPRTVERTFEALLDEIPRMTAASALLCTSLVYKLLSHMAPGENKKTAAHDYIDEAILFLTNHYDEPITVADCARVVGLDVSYFSRLFRARTGVPPRLWLATYRLDRAAMLLTESDMKISEIARAVGIADPLYFSRCFTHRFGVPPRDYRRRSCSKEPMMEAHLQEKMRKS